MHSLMIVLALGLAGTARWAAPNLRKSYPHNWQQSLFLFLFPPLLLVMTAIAVACMGYRGKMLGIEASFLSYCLAVSFTILATLFLLKNGFQAWRSIGYIRRYPQGAIAGRRVRIIDTPFPYSAQIGLWEPELVLSEGLLETLDSEQLKAVLAHEEAHHYYRDTFWFFWLGWLRDFTGWLPNTQVLWQDLLLWREIRADRQAARQIDSLLLAESLLSVAQAVYQHPDFPVSESICAAFNEREAASRLAERIDWLLSPPDSQPLAARWSGRSIWLALIPLVTIPLHY